MKTLMIAAATLATLIVTSVTEADARPGFRGGGYRGGGYRGVAVGRGYRGGIGRPGWGAAGPIAGRPGWGGAGRPGWGAAGPIAGRPGWGRYGYRPYGGYRGYGYGYRRYGYGLAAAGVAAGVRRRVLRRLRALCLLQLILRRLSLLLTGNTSIDERRFEAITSPAGVLGG